MRTTRWLPWIVVLGFFIYGCGADVCVGPFPATCYQKDADGTTSTSGTLKVAAPKDPISQGETITFTVSGGVSPYSFRLPAKGNMTSTGVYTAPTGESKISVYIEVLDAKNQLANTAIAIQ